MAREGSVHRASQVPQKRAHFIEMALAGFAVGRQRTLSMWSGKSCLFCDWVLRLVVQVPAFGLRALGNNVHVGTPPGPCGGCGVAVAQVIFFELSL